MVSTAASSNVVQHLPGAALNDIIVDSVATSHMFNTLEGLLALSPCNTTVRLADGSAVRVSLKGRVRLSLVDERRDIIVLELRDVLYVPSLSHPLFSVPAFL